ncbi:MAG TPA: hypothetical protein VNF68_12410, partial [Candidatus Baltobacteraceae bacterium]|nr:hypothetical protein [Candidatus Baltobacteraceae bacterium]
SLVLAAFSSVHSRVVAYPLATPADSTPQATPTSPLRGDANVLPIDSTLSFVLDGTISSASSSANEIVTAHLKDALVLNGTTIAAAGTPVRIRILDVKHAENPDIYGYVDIYFYPLLLASGGTIPLRPPTSHLNVNVSAGHESTVGVENTIGDIFSPTLLLHVFRKGRNFTLEPGATIRARTQATVSLTHDGTIAIATPAPVVLDAETPHATFKAMPLSTPGGGTPQLAVPSIDPSTPGP